MKLTFLLNKDVWYYEKDALHIVKWLKKDYFFVEDAKEAKRLSELREMWKPVFKAEDISEEVVVKEILEKENKQKETNDKAKTLDSSDIRALYEAKFGKEVPRNKKNDEEWIKAKLQEETPSES